MYRRISALLLASVLATPASQAATADAAFEAELAAIQAEWDAANYQVHGKKARHAAFEALLEHAGRFATEHAGRAEALGWHGIVLSTYAGEVSAMTAMKYAKAARDALLRAEQLDPAALDGGIYASLGALYSKVPGGMLGFGDDVLAQRYFEKALEVSPGGIDNNYFYGEFLVDQGEYMRALAVLNRALQAPMVSARPAFDAGRRAEIRELIAIAARKTT